MTTLDDIKSTFPDWPDDVIDQWLVPYAKTVGFGWPPSQPLKKNPWNQVLCARPLDWWKKVKWEKHSIDLTFEKLSHIDQFNFRQTHAFLFKNEQNAHSTIPNSRERMESCLRYLAEHGTLPRPPVAMSYADGLQFVDGSHRVAALLICQSAGKDVLAQKGFCPLANAHEVWVAN